MLSIKAYAKINLYLDVISRYPDGYHQIESVMQSISLHDLVEISPSQDLSISCTKEELSNKENLAYRAAEMLRATVSKKAGAHIHIKKNIPVAAGLAGGSADAAATLLGLNILWGLDFSLDQLQGIGARLGADIPFCLAGGTMLAEGRGERLSKLNAMPEAWIVVITPPLHISTAEIYHMLDERELAPLYLVREFYDALSSGDVSHIGLMLKNLLEEVVLPIHPEIDGIKKLALDSGALGALMSGSGPSVFALCQDEESAKRVASIMRSRDETLFVEIARPVGWGVEVL
ncbi:MAG: 4-(cytidine 5'-diphospho)-2-C-methyl-D-erythritol kinase [Firmicutes bacterium]|nr:4-(cytidine 5'-diphospho)-2-C-methyl-D-erythritol kinase [Bacillota bacterium]